jgi:Dihydrodipicolinate synthase/N-acetylneuraminate lyase
MLLSGIFPPITTPFYPDGKVYFKKLESNVERYSRTPVSGIVVLGSTGEAIMLSDQERRDVLKVARDATAPKRSYLREPAANRRLRPYGSPNTPPN